MGFIRFFLAICVVTSHCGNVFSLPMMTGNVAVQLFYIVSGFYMSIILNEKYNLRSNSYWLFISNRLLRLYPIYFLILIFTLGLCWLGNIKSDGLSYVKLDIYFQYKLSLSSYFALFFSNLLIVGQDFIMFLGLNIDSGDLFFTSNFRSHSPELHTFLFIPQAWTLSVEILFYVICPFILNKGVKKVLLFIFLSLIIRFFVAYGLDFVNDPWGYRFFPSELMFFLLGYISYYLLRNTKIVIHSVGINYAVLLSFIITILYYSAFPDFSFDYIPFGLKQIIVTILFVLILPTLFSMSENNKVDRFIGELSYPMYISHMFIFMFLGMYGLKSSILVLSVTVIFSIMLTMLVTNRVEKYRQIRVRKAKIL